MVLPRLAARRPVHRRQFEAFERETGRDGAAAQRPIAEGFRCLPGARRYCHLRDLVRMDIAAEPDDLFARAVDQRQLEGCAGVIVPYLDRVDAVPMRALAARQQEIDRGRGGGLRSSARMMSAAVLISVRIYFCGRGFRQTLGWAPCRPCRCRPRLPAGRRAETGFPSSRRR